MDKIKLRKEAKIKLRPIDKEVVKKIILESDLYKNSKQILIYMARDKETDLSFLLSSNKKILIPYCNEEMHFSPYDGKVEYGKYNILEPSNKTKTKIYDNALIFVPALSLDKNGNRLGRGKAYYDRFLLKYPKIIKVAIINKELLLDSITPELHDIKMDYIITDDGLFKV